MKITYYHFIPWIGAVVGEKAYYSQYFKQQSTTWKDVEQATWMEMYHIFTCLIIGLPLIIWLFKK